ncbi:DUF6364 family protein [Dyadobacter sp. CY323]|uniref:DUF6364 family protein n=1 Tax=Dyadobacter sp. CY323 TaxID=2907302 RepID=UPI001F355F82|nr:DUF6364 family protein [Dyadobacter sp. CY323]MCE6987981.1 DUF6364 family protein [Dyadobacter sp. CY323]
MNTKLTLTIEETVIQKAKKYAKEKERSLSDLIENFLMAITSEVEEEEIEITPLVRSMRGSFKAPKDLDYKKELQNILAEKYL